MGNSNEGEITSIWRHQKKKRKRQYLMWLLLWQIALGKRREF